MKLALTFTAVDAASGVLLSLEKKILGMGKDAQKVKRDFEDMIGHMRAGIKSLAFSKYIFDSFKPILKITADMEESFTELELSLRKTGENAAVFHEQLEKIKDTAGKVQLLFPFGQKEFIDAATIFAQSGMSREDIANPKGALYSAGALSSIGKVPLEYSAQLLSTAANIWGLKGEQLSQFADQSQRIGTTTSMHIKDQALALQESGAAAGILKISYQDTLTALGTISQMEGGPSKAGERFAEFSQRIMGSTKEEKKALKTAGFDFFDEKGNLKSFPLIVQNLQGLESGLKARGLTEQQILDLWKKIFQGRGEYAAYALGKTGDNSFQDIAKRQAESLDIQAKADKALEDFNTQIQALTGSVRTLVSDAFDPLLKSITPIIKTINDLLGPLDSFVKAHRALMKDIGIGLGALVAAGTAGGIYRIVRSIMSFTRVIRGLGVAVGGVTTAAEGAAGAATLAATGTAAFSGALALVSQYLGPFLIGIAAGKKILESEEDYKGKRAELIGELSGEKERVLNMLSKNKPGGELGDVMQGHLLRMIHRTPGAEIANVGFDSMKKMVPYDPSYAKMTSEERMKAAAIVKPQNNITLNIHIDQDGRVTSSSNDANTTSKINLKRGAFDFGPLTD